MNTPRCVGAGCSWLPGRLRGWGDYVRTGNAATKFPPGRPVRDLAPEPVLAHISVHPDGGARVGDVADVWAGAVAAACEGAWRRWSVLLS